ncbi:MAG TPA: hypothetical protein VNA15_11800 [Candidatus Angelobacter sp.]|nr:hypothetical protein [Candidatus Angelobacter sp.]
MSKSLEVGMIRRSLNLYMAIHGHVEFPKYPGSEIVTTRATLGRSWGPTVMTRWTWSYSDGARSKGHRDVHSEAARKPGDSIVVVRLFTVSRPLPENLPL